MAASHLSKGEKPANVNIMSDGGTTPKIQEMLFLGAVLFSCGPGNLGQLPLGRTPDGQTRDFRVRNWTRPSLLGSIFKLLMPISTSHDLQILAV